MQKRNDSGKRFDKKGGKNPPSFSSSKKSFGNDDSKSGRKPSSNSSRNQKDDGFKPKSRAKSYGDSSFSPRSGKSPDRFGDDKFSSSPRRPGTRSNSDRFSDEKKSYSRNKNIGEDQFSSSSRKPSARGTKDKFDNDRKPYSRNKNTGEDKFSSGSRKPGSRTSSTDRFDADKKSSYGKNTSSRRVKDEFNDEPKKFVKPDNINSKETFRKKGISEDAKPLKGKSTKEKTKFEFRSVRKAKFADEKNTKVNKKTAEQDLNAGEIRLNRFIANAGICSRREADTLITAGLVTINGAVVTEMGYKVKAGDDIRYNGERLSVEEKIYILMNKPKDAITTADDPEGRKTVFDLIEGKLAQRVFAVGRLDRNTTGVLLLTNDGDLAQRLMHPKYEVEKVYIATLNKDLTKNDLWQLAGGVELEDGLIKPDAVAYAEESKKDVIGVEIHSGRNRIVHRMFEHMGYLVDKLDRVAYAGLTKSKLKRGEWRELTEKELKTLKRNVKLG